MTSENPYSTPAASVDIDIDETYSPNFLSFQGRIGRVRYLGYSVGLNFVMYLVMGIFSAMFIPMISSSGNIEPFSSPLAIAFTLVMGILFIAGIAYSLGFSVRRLNDLDKTGWLVLLMFIPIVSLFLAIYLLFFPGTKSNNRYGSAPKANSLSVMILGIILPILLIVVLAAIAIPTYQDYVTRAQQAQMGAQQRAMELEAQMKALE